MNESQHLNGDRYLNILIFDNVEVSNKSTIENIKRIFCKYHVKYTICDQILIYNDLYKESIGKHICFKVI